jgi:hypothetical protein
MVLEIPDHPPSLVKELEDENFYISRHCRPVFE